MTPLFQHSNLIADNSLCSLAQNIALKTAYVEYRSKKNSIRYPSFYDECEYPMQNINDVSCVAVWTLW